MKNCIYLLLPMLLIACGNKGVNNEQSIEQDTCQHETKTWVMLVGTYTDSLSCGVYSYSVDEEMLTYTLLDSVKTPNPSFLTWSASGETVYAVREDGSDSAAVVAIPFEDGHFGTTLVVRQTKGRAPCYVATNGKLLITANYGGGNMSVFPVEDEIPGACTACFAGAKTGPDKERQEAPHVHCAVFTPDNKYVMATDFSADRILSFKIEDQKLVLHDTIGVAAGTAPRHLAFAPNGKEAYVIGELSGKVTAFKYNEGSLEKFQEILADPLEARGSGDIKVSADGRFLYVSNRLKGDGIAIFSIGKDGWLKRIGYQNTGRHPRNFCLTPDGKFLFCACRDANQIEVYVRDAESGMLIATGMNIKVNKPVFVGFVEK